MRSARSRIATCLPFKIFTVTSRRDGAGGTLTPLRLRNMPESADYHASELVTIVIRHVTPRDCERLHRFLVRKLGTTELSAADSVDDLRPPSGTVGPVELTHVRDPLSLIPPPPPDSTFRRVARKWRSIPRSAKVLVAWTAGLILFGAALFLWLAMSTKANIAFDILTQHQSPIAAKIGVSAVVLSIFGYFVSPAAIGALVAAVFITSSQVSARARQRRATSRTRLLYPQGSCDNIERLSADAAIATSDDNEER